MSGNGDFSPACCRLDWEGGRKKEEEIALLKREKEGVLQFSKQRSLVQTQNKC